MEQAIITGVAHDRSEGKVTVVGVPDLPGYAAKVFRVARRRRDQHRHGGAEHLRSRTASADITFTLPRDGPTALAALEKVKHTVGFSEVLYDDHIGKVSLVGAGMRTHPGVTAKFCEALAEAGVNIDLISTSEIRISVSVRDTELDKAVRALHEAFDLGGDEEAVVYGGTGTMSMVSDGLRVGIVGATGRSAPVMRAAAGGARTSRCAELRFFASARSAGQDAAVGRRRDRGRGRRDRRPGRPGHRAVLRRRDDVAGAGAAVRRGRASP